MNTLQIHKYLTSNIHTKKVYEGTFAADQIPKKQIKKPSIYIMNLEESSKSGSHWITIYLTTRTMEIFDSGGRKLENHYFLDELKNYHSDKKFAYNNKQIQNNFTSTCGNFCCIFSLCKAKKIATKHFINMFDEKDLEKNEKLIMCLFKKHFKKCNKNQCKQSCRKLIMHKY